MPHFEEYQAPYPEDLIIEVPAQYRYPGVDPLPNGMTPMGEIDARGRLYQGTSAGRAPWWVIIASWPIIGFPGLVFLGFSLAQIIHAFEQLTAGAITRHVFAATATVWILPSLLALAIVGIPARGTVAKLKRSFT
ncbi:MAG: hypothetical protein AAGC54_04590 [Cyanobacteria bacterium P01_F01_bin.4]